MRPIKKGASFQKEIKTRQPHSRTPNRKDAPVAENKVVSLDERAKDEAKPFSEQLLQEGAKKLLQTAIENEVIDYIQFQKDRRDEHGQQLVVRNGHLPEREVVSGVGLDPGSSATGPASGQGSLFQTVRRYIICHDQKCR
jgi:hypothetical protein